MWRARLACAQASRRDLLRDVAYAAAGVAFASAADEACAVKGKKSQRDIAYQDTPKGVERCEICTAFVPPDQCRTVEGPVGRRS